MVTHTVCIACVDKHIALMEKMLEALKDFVIKPDKVLVSMSPKFLDLDLEFEKQRLEQRYPFLFCIVHTKVTGSGGNLNSVFPMVNTDYATIWGADDYYHPQYFEILNHIINKNKDHANIIVHSYDFKLTKLTENDPSLAFNPKVFKSIDLDKIKTYDKFYLNPEGTDTFRFYSTEFGNDYPIYNNFVNMHYGFQTFKSHIVRDNLYKSEARFANRCDTLYLVDMYQKYGCMIFINENMVQYMPSHSY
jgi:hypothetical protein